LQNEGEPAGLVLRLQAIERALTRLSEDEPAHRGLIRDLEELHDRCRAELDRSVDEEPKER
jgi:hypothetical protein